MFQSLLELLANKAKCMPRAYDWDRLTMELTAVPLRGAAAYDGVFSFLERHLHIDMEPSRVGQSFLNFLLPSMPGQGPGVTVHGQDYTLEAAPVLKKEISRILASQETCPLSGRVRINRLLKRFGKTGNRQVKIRLTHIDPGAVRLVGFYLDGRLLKEFSSPPFTFIFYNFGAQGQNRTIKGYY